MMWRPPQLSFLCRHEIELEVKVYICVDYWIGLSLDVGRVTL